MVTLSVAEDVAHPPEAAIVFVIVYVPAVLAERSITPLLVLANTIPEEELNVPAVPPPENVGEGLFPL